MWIPTIALLPGALTIYLGFDGGGYFPPGHGRGVRRRGVGPRTAPDARRSPARGVRPLGRPGSRRDRALRRLVARVELVVRLPRSRRRRVRPRASLPPDVLAARHAPADTGHGAARAVRDRGRSDVRVPRRPPHSRAAGRLPDRAQ